MRLAKISKLVSKAGLCDVYGDEYGTGVYIGVGNAIYHVQDLPMPCAGDQMRIMLDIPTKKWEKVSCVIHACPPPLDMSHTASGEMLMTEYNLMTGSNYLILVDEHSKGEDKEKRKACLCGRGIAGTHARRSKRVYRVCMPVYGKRRALHYYKGWNVCHCGGSTCVGGCWKGGRAAGAVPEHLPG